jgi:hypothetical protein
MAISAAGSPRGARRPHLRAREPVEGVGGELQSLLPRLQHRALGGVRLRFQRRARRGAAGGVRDGGARARVCDERPCANEWGPSAG